MNELRPWLQALGLDKYTEVFEENDIDRELLPDLTEEDLEKLGVSMGHRKKLLRAIEFLDQDNNPADPEVPADDTSSPPIGQAEWRQLTIMFADLVGSTPLSRQLDAEDLRALILSYQTTVVREIKYYGGHVARYMGDGVLAYFGWPQAHEDDGARAVHAGLALTAAVAELSTPAGEPLAARVGIATGLVVVGDLIGEGAAQEEAVVGDTPNIAARLQGLATSGSVVISHLTRQLLGEEFELEPLRSQALKGIDMPVDAYAVLRERAVESRFEAHHSDDLLSLIGRQEELSLLTERWEQSCGGEGQLVLLSGEAGIGKSRITQALLDRVASGLHKRIRYQCSPYHTDSMLYPVIQHLGSAANINTQDPADTRLEKLERLLAHSDIALGETVALLAALLGIDTEHRHGKLGLTPQQQRDRTLEVVIELLLVLARQRPVLWVVEDVHWIDPTTWELIDLALDRISSASVMILLTARPTFKARFGGHPHVTQLTLNRLRRDYIGAMIGELTHGKPLPREVLEEIFTKTDGVPLFVEELTKTILESELLRETEDAFVLNGPLPRLAIPASLHDSLLARLDRVPGIKGIAQTAACIGREFSYELLGAVSDLPESELRPGLDSLVAAELIFGRGSPPATRFIFKHALVRDATYNSLLRTQRWQMHARIAQELERSLPETVEKEPELLAFHCTAGALHRKAVEYWQKAGELALQRSANVESVEHLRRGLDVVTQLEDESERAHLELALQAQLGPALIAAKGYGAPETARCFDRARELTEQVGDSPQLFPVLYGCWVYKLTWAEFVEVTQMAERFLELARKRADSGALLTGHRILGFSLSCRGDFLSARRNFEEVLTLYEPREHKSLAFRYGQDPRAAGAAMLGWNLWHLGYPDKAVEICDEAVAYAREIDHTNTQGYVETFGAARIQLFRRDREGVERYVNSLTELCETHQLIFWVGFIKAFEGWALAEQGRDEEAIDTIREGIAASNKTSTLMFKPHSYALLAQIHADCGRIDEGLHLINEALTITGDTSEHWITPELHRLKGEILRQYGDGTVRAHDEAEACFRRALADARARSAKSWELRTATSLARLWRDLDRRKAAIDLLAPVYEWFTEGFDTADLKEATQLLEELDL